MSFIKDKLKKTAAFAAAVLALATGIPFAFAFDEEDAGPVYIAQDPPRLAESTGARFYAMQSEYAALAPSDYDVYPLPADTSLAGKTVFLDPGHGKTTDKGYAGYSEQYYNLQIALTVKADLENCGATVIMTRSTEDHVDNLVRVSNVNKHALLTVRSVYQAKIDAGATGASLQQLSYDVAQIDRLCAVMQSVADNPALAEVYYNSPYDYSYTRVIHPDLKAAMAYEAHPIVASNFLYISIHSNATGTPVNESVNGTVVYYMTNDLNLAQNYFTGYTGVERSHYFAEHLLQRVCEAGSFRSRGLAVNDFFMLREHNIPAALLETGFHTNPSDRAKLMDVTYQRRIANAVTLAAKDYFAYADTTWPAAQEVPLDLASSTYVVSSDGVTGIEASTTVGTLISQLTSTHTIVVTDRLTGSAKAYDAPLCTSDRVCLFDGANNLYASYPIIIYGDPSCDGNVDALDLLVVQKYLLSIKNLSGATFLSADVNKNEGVTILDLLRLQKHLLGLTTITQ